jgi:glycine/D-amino acid oxidase-like deaminating enzyme
MAEQADIVIFGGGIWGLSTAYRVAATWRVGRVVTFANYGGM